MGWLCTAMKCTTLWAQAREDSGTIGVMYKRVIIASVAIVVLVSPFAYADDAYTNLTAHQIDLIKANCISVKSTLTRLHANDALSRVHLGQEYETISTKLMAPMNGRVALNKLNGVELTKTTVKFNDSIVDFRNFYKNYEQTLSRTLEMNCISQPVEFYNTLKQAQADRATVRVSVEKLADLVTQYQKQLNVVRQEAHAVQGQEDITQ